MRLSEPFTDYDKAFYDFFIPKRLGKLSLETMRQVLEHKADAQGAAEVKQRLHERPSRIKALFELTGGNLRALGLIFDLLRNGSSSRAVEDFERLMDSTTPYYKARFEDLSEQAQVVMHALAVRSNGLRFGHTAAEIAKHAGLPTNTVSAQLDILEREGVVEKSAAHGRTQYRIAEQLFRLWLQMRSTRRIRQNVLDLTRFFEAMFTLEELQAHMAEQSGTNPLAEARFAFMMAGTQVPWHRGLQAHGLDRVRQCSAGGLSTAEQTALLGSLDLSLEQKQASVQALGTEAAAEATRLRPCLKAEAAYRKAIELDPTDALPWNNLSLLLEEQGCLEAASAAHARGVALDEDAGKDVNLWRWLRYASLQIRIRMQAARQALEANNQPALRDALSLPLTEITDIVAALAGTEFVEGFLAPLLKNADHAKTVLNAMRELGYEKHARPLVLAFEAALIDREDLLAELEPEIQGAAKHMFARLSQ